MGPYRKLWFTLIAVLAVTFSLLGFYGGEVYRQAPPIPTVVAADGQRLFGRDDILTGRPPGSRWAACSWARSGATAPTRRRTGRPTGCTASWAPGWTWRRARRTASPTPNCPRRLQAALRETLKAEYRGNRVNADEVLTVRYAPRAGHRPDRRLL